MGRKSTWGTPTALPLRERWRAGEGRRVLRGVPREGWGKARSSLRAPRVLFTRPQDSQLIPSLRKDWVLIH